MNKGKECENIPRKKEVLKSWFEGDNAIDSIFCRLPYYMRQGEGYIMTMRDNPKSQRQVKCNECHIIIPRDTPRIARNGSWYAKGHLCMKCAKEEMKRTLERIESFMLGLKEDSTLIHTLLECIAQVENDKRYEEKLGIGRFMQLIGENGRRNS